MRGNGQECQMGMIPDGTLRESLMTKRSLVISVLAEAEGSSITKDADESRRVTSAHGSNVATAGG